MVSPTKSPTIHWTHEHHGLLLGRYLVVNRLKDTFTHHLYRGRSLAGDQEVEIKLMTPDYALMRAGRGQVANPYVNELRIATRLGSSCALRHLAAGATAEGQPYLVRQAWTGTRGDELVTPLRFLEAISVVVDAAAAVDACHQHGMIYVNLDVENLALARTDGAAMWTARLKDLQGIRWRASATTPSAPMSPAAITPEDFLDLEPSEATDVFHLGALTYALLAGQPAFGHPGDSLDSLKAALTGETPVPAKRLYTLRDDLSEDADMFLTKCLQRHPSARPRSVGYFIRGIHHLVMCFAESHPQEDIPPELWHRLSRGLASG